MRFYFCKLYSRPGTWWVKKTRTFCFTQLDPRRSIKFCFKHFMRFYLYFFFEMCNTFYKSDFSTQKYENIKKSKNKIGTWIQVNNNDGFGGLEARLRQSTFQWQRNARVNPPSSWSMHKPGPTHRLPKMRRQRWAINWTILCWFFKREWRPIVVKHSIAAYNVF